MRLQNLNQAKEKLRSLWLAWQQSSMDNSEPQETRKKAQFQEVMAAVHAPHNLASKNLEDMVLFIKDARELMLKHLKNMEVVFDSENIRLYRGIHDEQALEALQLLVKDGKWLMPPNPLMSLTITQESANGHAFRGAWAGIGLYCRILITDVLLVPQAIWTSSNNLDPEDEVLVRPSAAIQIVPNDVLLVTPAQRPTTNHDVKNAKRMELNNRFETWMRDNNLSHDLLAKLFKNYHLS
jgi:hypothetical protein